MKKLRPDQYWMLISFLLLGLLIGTWLLFNKHIQDYNTLIEQTKNCITIP